MTTVILVREWLVELLWLGVIYSMARRWRAASPLQRRAMGPPFIAGALLGLLHIAYYTARQLGAPSATVVALSSAWTLCIVAVCGGFLIGLLWRRITLAGALAQLGLALRADDDRLQLQKALAAALGDPTTRVLFHHPALATWEDARGRPSAGPGDIAAGRAATVIHADQSGHGLALIHRVALRDDPELLDGVSDMVLAGLRHERLTADLSAALNDLEDSRRRIAEAADVERARIERDLHDGAQQRLIALRIRLGLTEELLRTDPGAAVREVHRLGFEAGRALEELRSIADGVYPPLLTDRGLRDALRSLTMQAPMPVQVVAVGITRHPVELEAAVYFTCAEALQNALKHATGATGVWIRLTQTRDRLSFEIADDGAGFAPHDQAGHGLRNMHDRIEALGGTLSVEARPGRGTRVMGSVRLPRPTAAPGQQGRDVTPTG
jgi:signal transduction histidine kinase